MVEEVFDLAERGPLPEPEGGATPTPTNTQPPKQKVDPTKMVISRSRQMVTTSGTSSQPRTKTPTRKK